MCLHQFNSNWFLYFSFCRTSLTFIILAFLQAYSGLLAFHAFSVRAACSSRDRSSDAIRRRFSSHNGIVRRLFRLKHRENLLSVTARFWWLSSPLALGTNLVMVNALRIVNIFSVPMDYCNGSMSPDMASVFLKSDPPDMNSKLIANVEIGISVKGKPDLLTLKEKLNFVLSDVINGLPVRCTHRECALRLASRDWSGSKERLFSMMNSENFLTNTGS
jgi:hypothetical protein